MADVNKTVEINYKADLSQLLQKMKEMPGITEAEAKKMVSSLNTQLRKAEKSAKSAAKGTKVAMKQMQVSAKATSTQFKTLRRDAANLDRIMGEAAVGLELVSPELASMAMAGSAAASGLEALGRVITGVNPIFLALAAAAASFAIAASVMADDTKEIAETAKKARKELEGLRQATGGIAKSANEASLELAIMQGVISSLDAEKLKLEKQLSDEAEAGLEAQRKRIALLQSDVELIRQAGSAGASLNEEQGKRLKALSSTHDILKGIGDLEEGGISGMQIRLKAQKLLEEEVSKEKQGLSDLNQSLQDTISLRTQILDVRANEEEQAKRDQEAEKQKAEALKRREAAQKAILDLKKQQEQIDTQTRGIQISLMSAEEQISARLQDKLSALQQISEESRGQVDTAEAEQALREQAESKLAQLAQKRREAEEKGREKALREAQKQFDTEIANLDRLIAKEEERRQKINDGFMTMASSSIEAIDTVFSELSARKQETVSALTEQLRDQDNQLTESQRKNIEKRRDTELKALNRAFKIEQAAKISQIAMATATAIMQGFASLGPIGGAAAAAGIGALGTAQAAIVVSQQPPSFHTGGIVRRDNDPTEISAVLRQGEGVLTQQGVAAAGGEQGIDALNRGAPRGPQTYQIVMGHKTIEAGLLDNQRRGGALARAISSQSPVGRANHYRSM